MKLSLDIYGEEQIDRDLLRFSSYVGDPRPALLKIADDMRDQIAEQFESEGRRGSGGWEALKPATLAEKAARGLPPEILQATRKLMYSLTRKGGDHIEEVTDDSLLVGSRIPYGRFHQRGTSRMPARRPVDFTDLDRRSFVRILQRYITTGEV